MYKVFLVDDEINILKGIAMLVDWKKCGTKLVVEAHYGQMALDFLQQEVPDIVITDIKMPGMNGIELIKNIHASYPDVKFIILSGYDEFTFAKTAMAYGVKHYLLKPSNETKIEQALCEVVNELEKQKQKEQFIQSMHEKLEQIIPKAKIQFLKEYMMNKQYGIQEWENHRTLFPQEQLHTPLRLIVMTIDKEHEYEHIFALKEMIVTEMKQRGTVPFESTVGDRVVILSDIIQIEKIMKILKRVQQLFSHVYQLTFTAAISSQGYMKDIRTLYKEALKGLSNSFYLGAGSIITNIGIETSNHQELNFQYDHDELILSIRSGDQHVANQYIHEFFEYMKQNRYDENVVKSHSMELLMAVIRQANKEYMEVLFKQMFEFTELSTMDEIQSFIEEVVEKVTDLHFANTKQVQSSIIQTVIQYINEHMVDEELTLNKIANEVVYMNPDYLGKLFKKEMGEKFSSYLTKKRLDRAMQLLEETSNVKTLDVAEAVGYGNNPRYFSQVFKKYTGYTPSEYKYHHEI